MNIIIEGTDCVGKTAAINEFLKDNSKYKYTHYSNPEDLEDGKEQYFGLVGKLNFNNNLILDRCMLSETVYGPMFRGYYPFYMRQLERTIENTIIILLTASKEKIEERFDGKFIKINQIEDIQNAYIREFSNSNYEHKFSIDTSNINAKQVGKIISHINEVVESGNKQL